LAFPQVNGESTPDSISIFTEGVLTMVPRSRTSEEKARADVVDRLESLGVKRT